MKGFGVVNMALASPQVKIAILTWGDAKAMFTSSALSQWWRIFELIRFECLHEKVVYIFIGSC